MAYKSKSDMVDDIMFVCNCGSDVLMDDCLASLGWHWTENNPIIGRPKAKTWGCEFWTPNAFNKAFDTSGGKISRKGINSNTLQHEHVVPRKVFIDGIKDADAKGTLARGSLINALKNFFACVVTSAEAKGLDKFPVMPSGVDFFGITDPWERYKALGYTWVWKIEWVIRGKSWQPVSVTKVPI